MAARFIGRRSQLDELARLLPSKSDGGNRPGKALLIRGRRRVGKSRLVEEFLEHADVPYVFFTASTRSTAEELALFVQEVGASNLPRASLFGEVEARTWDAALRLLASALPQRSPSVVVIDELPYLTISDPGFEGTLQAAFDRSLSRLPVLIIGVGSDLAMMEALNEYGRPFHQRATEMVIPPLSPAEVGELLELEPAEAFDAYLITGGLPLVCVDWQPGQSMWDYLDDALARSTSPLLVSAERSLAAEFPPAAQAREVLETIGSGETTFTAIGRRAGIRESSLSRVLTTLTQKRVVASATPLSTRRSRETRYHVADPHLRFWLQFLGPGFAEIERGRGDRVLARIRTSWGPWRGRAVEPVVREALDRLGPTDLGLDDALPTLVAGAFWTRTNDVEVDVVLADRSPVATQIAAVGSIKWRERAGFNLADVAALAHHRDQVPGATAHTPLLAVSRVPGDPITGLTVLTPADLITAWS